MLAYRLTGTDTPAQRVNVVSTHIDVDGTGFAIIHDLVEGKPEVCIISQLRFMEPKVKTSEAAPNED